MATLFKNKDESKSEAPLTVTQTEGQFEWNITDTKLINQITKIIIGTAGD